MSIFKHQHIPWNCWLDQISQQKNQKPRLHHNSIHLNCKPASPLKYMEKLTSLNSLFVCVIPEMSYLMHVSSAHQLSYIAGGSMLAHECFIFSQHSKWPQFPQGLGFFNVMYMPRVIAVMILLSLACSLPLWLTCSHAKNKKYVAWVGIYCKHLSTFIVNHVVAVTACIDIKVSDGARLKHLSKGFIPGNSHTHTHTLKSAHAYTCTHAFNIKVATC